MRDRSNDPTTVEDFNEFMASLEQVEADNSLSLAMRKAAMRVGALTLRAMLDRAVNLAARECGEAARVRATAMADAINADEKAGMVEFGEALRARKSGVVS